MRPKLLSEKLIAFRDSLSPIGIMDHRCLHRRVLLFSATNGICRVYRGRKYDVDGNFLNMDQRATAAGFQA